MDLRPVDRDARVGQRWCALHVDAVPVVVDEVAVDRLGRGVSVEKEPVRVALERHMIEEGRWVSECVKSTLGVPHRRMDEIAGSAGPDLDPFPVTGLLWVGIRTECHRRSRGAVDVQCSLDAELDWCVGVMHRTNVDSCTDLERTGGTHVNVGQQDVRPVGLAPRLQTITDLGIRAVHDARWPPGRFEIAAPVDSRTFGVVLAVEDLARDCGRAVRSPPVAAHVVSTTNLGSCLVVI